jgi:hypothetical protein
MFCQIVQFTKFVVQCIKFFALCDAKNFYCSNLEIYCGIQPPEPYDVRNTPTDIVKQLVSPIENSNKTVTTDNWYTKHPTLVLFAGKENNPIGNNEENKCEIPSEFLPKKPKIIPDYTMTKGAVDTCDKMCASYSVSRVTRRWPLAVFYILMNIAGFNSWVIYTCSGHRGSPAILVT